MILLNLRLPERHGKTQTVVHSVTCKQMHKSKSKSDSQRINRLQLHLPLLQDCKHAGPLQISISQWKYTWRKTSYLRLKKKKIPAIHIIYLFFFLISLTYQVFRCLGLHKREQLDHKPFMKRGILPLLAGDNWQHSSSVAVTTERTSGLDTKMSFSCKDVGM